LAAVLGKECDERIHRLVIGAVDDETAFLPTLRKAGTHEPGEMERKRRWRQRELLPDRACGEPGWPHLHQEAENRQAGFLGESGKGRNRLLRFHISNNMEMTADLSSGTKIANSSGADVFLAH
jgi:hypothetical protein